MKAYHRRQIYASPFVPHGVPDPALADKDTLAIHVKLNEIISSLEGASKGLVSVEDLSEVELQTLKARYQRMMDDVAAEQASRRI
jgi:low affinity Fe/Cu permease